MPDRSTIHLRDFDPASPADIQAFRTLSEEWITRHFAPESKDTYNLAQPQETILTPGGRIFLAVQQCEQHQTPIGCALLSISPGEYEVAKMAVTATAQGTGTLPPMLKPPSSLFRLVLKSRQLLIGHTDPSSKNPSL